MIILWKNAYAIFLWVVNCSAIVILLLLFLGFLVYSPAHQIISVTSVELVLLVFEDCMYERISSVLFCLIKIVLSEEWRSAFDKSSSYIFLLTDIFLILLLFQAFDDNPQIS